MYCGDNRGTDIDHFEPIKVAPLRTFEWVNHLLACSSCNSNAKRDQYPCDENGRSLLIDPSSEDPHEHLRLLLSNGIYEPISLKGRATIDVFQLNRADLRRGREMAFPRCKAMVREYSRLIDGSEQEEADLVISSLCEQPFADVLDAMHRSAHLPGAPIVLGGEDVVTALLKSPLNSKLFL
ncbi:HNH endonuclease [Sphaerisporangium sp. NPDC051017]|uniref:HNH endonuclease n=1 Tax=Sphaerisporangium sp. NPDC051017 TaxID=3154636 RepID=UPI00344498A2